MTAGLVLRTALGVALPAAAYAVPDPLHLDGLTSNGVVALPDNTSVPVRVFPVLGIALLVAVAADRFLVASRIGRAMRSVAEDADAATLCGVPVERVLHAPAIGTQALLLRCFARGRAHGRRRSDSGGTKLHPWHWC